MSVLTVTLNPCIDKSVYTDGIFEIPKLSREDPGGKGINVARVLKRSETECICSGIMPEIGADIIYDCLNLEGIKHRFLKVPGKLRTNLKLTDTKLGITTERNGKNTLENPEDFNGFFGIYEDLLEVCEIVVLSGSIACGILEDVYKDLILRAKKLGRRVVLDTSGAAFGHGIEAVPYAIKPNILEFEEFLGRKIASEDDLKSEMCRLVDSGIEIVAVSMGADGAAFADKNTFYRTKPFKADIKSTVGAGDSMVAAIVYSMLKGYDLGYISRLATAAGTLTATFDGTDFCSLKRAELFMDKIGIINTNK